MTGIVVQKDQVRAVVKMYPLISYYHLGQGKGWKGPQLGKDGDAV